MGAAGADDVGARRRSPRRDRLPTAPLTQPSTTKQTQHSKMKCTIMKTEHNILSKINLGSALAVLKNRVPIITTCLIGAGLLAVATSVSVEQKTLAAQPPADPAHAAHVAAGAMPPDAAKGDPALSQQLSQLQAKVAQLEAALARNARRPAVAAAPAAGAMPGMAAPAGGTMNMMAQMDRMMGMMEKMMSMGGGAMPAGAPMAGGAGGQGMGMMEDDMGEMGAMQPGPGAPAAANMGGMGGGASPPGVDAGMAARMDKMIGMMDMMVRMMDRTVGMMDRMTGGTGGGSMQPGQGTPPMGGTGMMDDDMGEMAPMQPGQAAPPMGGDM